MGRLSPIEEENCEGNFEVTLGDAQQPMPVR